MPSKPVLVRGLNDAKMSNQSFNPLLLGAPFHIGSQSIFHCRSSIGIYVEQPHCMPARRCRWHACPQRRANPPRSRANLLEYVFHGDTNDRAFTRFCRANHTAVGGRIALAAR